MIPKIDFKYREGDFRSNYPYLSRILCLGEVETPMVDFGQLKMKLEYFSPTFPYEDRGAGCSFQPSLPPSLKVPK